MHARLSGVAVEPHAVRVPRHAVHDGPRRAAGRVNLKAEIIVRARNGMVVLVDYKVCAERAPCVGRVDSGVVSDGEAR